MIDELDEVIRQLLIAELPIKNSEIDIAFDQPKREWSARIARPTVNLFLYDVRDNPTLRSHQWETMPPNGRGDSQTRMKRTPFRVDCFYMLTAWASEPDDEHRLLSRCLMALFRHPIIPPDRLTGSLKNQPFDIQARLASHDKLTNPAEVWSALDNEMRPSISYLVTLALDPWSEVTVPLVRTRILRAGQTLAPEKLAQLSADGALPASISIGGTIWDKFPGGTRQKGIPVALKGTGHLTTTDDQGRYLLNNLPGGDYTLVAWPDEGKPVEKKVKVPTDQGDYDLVIGK